MCFQRAEIAADHIRNLFFFKMHERKPVCEIEKADGAAEKERIPSRQSDAGLQKLHAALENQIPAVVCVKRVSENHKYSKKSCRNMTAQFCTNRQKAGFVYGKRMTVKIKQKQKQNNIRDMDALKRFDHG